MTKSSVYFTDFRTTFRESLPQKLRRLLKTAGIEQLPFHNRYTAIKIHFGELGNLAFLRPNYAKVIVDIVKEQGGKAFLTDSNTLYVGSRKNALDHLDTAYANGFSPFSTGCHILIADGLKGTDEVIIPIDGELVQGAKVGRALADADIIISLNHFKGHELAGFGGALKNIGMGGGSRAGKMEMHSSGKPEVNTSKCVGCEICRRQCAHGGVTVSQKKAVIDPAKCVGCGRCIGLCPEDAMVANFDESSEHLNKKMAEYAAAVLKDKPHFHVSLVVDVSPYCDCYGANDVPIVPDVGMLASFDPVALDLACANLVNDQRVNPHSSLAQKKQASGDHFKNLHPLTDWHFCLNHGEKLGLGCQEYELIEM